MFRKIKMCRRQTNSGLSSIKVPSENSEEYITIDTPAEIEEKLLERNQQHFGQAKGTFPTAPPFSKRIDWGSSTHTAELILEGEYQDEHLNEITKEFVNYMKRKTTLDEIL